MTDDTDVGSLAEETARLMAALGLSSSQSAGEGHRCPHGWCPVCRLADLVLDHPELVEDVKDAAARFAGTVLELLAAAQKGAGDD